MSSDHFWWLTATFVLPVGLCRKILGGWRGGFTNGLLWHSMNVVKRWDTQTLFVVMEFVLTVCIQGW